MADVTHYVVEMHDRRKRRRRYVRFAVLAGGIYALALGCLWLVFWSPILRFEKIVVERGMEEHAGTFGREQVPSREEVVDLLRGLAFLGGNPLHVTLDNFLLWPDQFTGDSLRSLPRLKSVVIEKKYSQSALVAKIYGRVPFGIWCKRSDAVECFWFDDEGVLFERSVFASGSLIVVVSDYRADRLSVGARAMPQEQMANLFSVLEVLARSNVAPKEINLKNFALQEIEVVTYEGPILYFSLRFPAYDSAAVIGRLKRSPGLGKLHYVDFRVKNRAYYK